MVSFVGYVRDFNDGRDVAGMFLEHYPGMTEKALGKIVVEAEQRWPLLKIEVLHRIGALEPGDPIVFVGVASAHRQAAFDACAFVMDYLKTRARSGKKNRPPMARAGLKGGPAMTRRQNAGSKDVAYRFVAAAEGTRQLLQVSTQAIASGSCGLRTARTTGRSSSVGGVSQLILRPSSASIDGS